MKRIIITSLFFLSLFLKFKSQVVFCPPGAEWHHTFTMLGMSPVNGTIQNHKTKYIKDSIIGIDTVKVLQHSRFFKECNFISNPITLIKQKGDTIFMRNTITQNNWQILYNFAALPGHSWKNSLLNSNSTIRTYTTTIDSINYINVNSLNLKQLYVKYSSNSVSNYTFTESAIITERFGCNTFLFNYHNETLGFCDYDYLSGFLCYQDSVFGLKQFTNKSCDYNISVGLKQNSNETLSFILSPNPANTYLNIEFIDAQKINKAVIVNNLGQIIFEISLNQDNKKSTINIDNLPSGSYLIRLIGSDHSENGIYKRFIIVR
jgi:hypothetical protein